MEEVQSGKAAEAKDEEKVGGSRPCVSKPRQVFSLSGTDVVLDGGISNWE